MAMLGYVLSGDNVYRCKEDNYQCPWPMKDGSDDARTWTLYADDYLTKSEDGTFMCHTGVCVFNLKPDESKLEKIDRDVKLVGV